MGIVIVIAIAVIVVNLAFVVVPARELRTLLAPPRRQASAPVERRTQPEESPEASVPRRAMPAPRREVETLRHSRQAIVLRSAAVRGVLVASAGAAGGD